jgi:L-lactate dehydrogenase complex protein LldG
VSARDDILAAIRENLPRIDRPLPKVPRFDKAPPPSLLGAFRKALIEMGGDFIEPREGSDPLDQVRERLRAARVVCSAVPEIDGDLSLSDVSEPQDLKDIDIGVVRAAFAVAETGSVCFTEKELGVNALGYLPQHLIVLLDPADIVLNLHHAYTRPEFRESCYTVFHSGPSATADIEGVLIHGAQGVRSLTVVPAPRRAPH